MSKKKIQWLVKDKQGLISGPHANSEVLKKIRSGMYMGEEQISLYPDGQWKSISFEESFFDELLKVLQDDMAHGEGFDDFSEKATTPVPQQAVPKPKAPQKPKREWGVPVVPEKVTDEKTSVRKTREKQKQSVAALSEKGKKGRAVEYDESLTLEEPDLKQTKQDAREKRKRKQAKVQRAQYEALRRRKARQRSFRSFLVVVLLGVIGFFWFYEEEPKVFVGERIRLLRPSYKKKSKVSQTTKSYEKGLAYFSKDSLSNYQKAQQFFVERVQTKKDLRAYSFLCMTYKELWGRSYQDTRDLQTILLVLRRAQKIDPNSQAASVCKVVDKWVRGNYQDALRIMESRLRVDPEMKFFNQMAGDIYAIRKEFSVAAYYFGKVREFWSPKPVWAKTLIQEARMMRRLKKYGEAITLYRVLLETYPQHAVGQIEKGILEFEVYQHVDKAKNHIHNGLEEKQNVPQTIESEAYLNLAKINLLQGDRKRGLKNSKKAFAIDSTNREARKLVISLGGIKALNSISIDNGSLVYVGEQYMKMENYSSAQSEFRAAYEANPKNAFAALRAGQALWRLNQGREAIDWVQKSVKANPKFVRSYVILADYMSARFDFENAIKALSQARKINKRHHEVWRGLALVELRRRNFKAAQRFAERAIKLYDTDVDALLILSKALKELGEYDLAYKTIQQASELDNSNEDVQSTYAKILVELQGAYAGEVYLQSLIAQMPKKLIFRRTLGEIYIAEERTEDAIDIFNEILAIDSRDKKTLMQMARVLQKKGEKDNFDGAREYLMDAAAIDPSDAEPLFQLGQLYLESNQPRYAQAQFARVIQVNIKYPLAHYNAGLAHLKLGQLDEALEMANTEKLMNPSLPEPNLLAGETFFKMAFSKDDVVASSSATQCADEYREAITKGYIVADAYIWLARCLRLTGALDPAESMLDEAEKLESGNPEIYKELGAIYEVKGSLGKAISWYKKYLRLSPQAKDADILKKRIQTLDGSREEAL